MVGNALREAHTQFYFNLDATAALKAIDRIDSLEAVGLEGDVVRLQWFCVGPEGDFPFPERVYTLRKHTWEADATVGRAHGVWEEGIYCHAHPFIPRREHGGRGQQFSWRGGKDVGRARAAGATNRFPIARIRGHQDRFSA